MHKGIKKNGAMENRHGNTQYEGRAAGGAAKPRMDRRAAGGRIALASGGKAKPKATNVNIKIVQPRSQDAAGPGQPAAGPATPPAAPPPPPRPPMPMPQQPMMGAPPPGGMPGAAPGGMSGPAGGLGGQNPLQALTGKGLGGLGLKSGGRAKRASGGKSKDSGSFFRSESPKEQADFQRDRITKGPHFLDPQDPRGGSDDDDDGSFRYGWRNGLKRGGVAKKRAEGGAADDDDDDSDMGSDYLDAAERARKPDGSISVSRYLAHSKASDDKRFRRQNDAAYDLSQQDSRGGRAKRAAGGRTEDLPSRSPYAGKISPNKAERKGYSLAADTYDDPSPPRRSNRNDSFFYDNGDLDFDKKGGRVKRASGGRAGQSTKDNLKSWSEYASKGRDTVESEASHWKGRSAKGGRAYANGGRTPNGRIDGGRPLENDVNNPRNFKKSAERRSDKALSKFYSAAHDASGGYADGGRATFPAKYRAGAKSGVGRLEKIGKASGKRIGWAGED